MKIDRIDINKKIFLSCLFLFIIGIGAFLLLPKEESLRNIEAGLRIGSGDDITGLLLESIVKVSKNMDVEGFISTEDLGGIKSFEFKDC